MEHYTMSSPVRVDEKLLEHQKVTFAYPSCKNTAHWLPKEIDENASNCLV